MFLLTKMLLKIFFAGPPPSFSADEWTHWRLRNADTIIDFKTHILDRYIEQLMCNAARPQPLFVNTGWPHQATTLANVKPTLHRHYLYL